MDSTPNPNMKSTASIATKYAAINLVSRESDRLFAAYQEKQNEGFELQSKRNVDGSIDYWDQGPAQTCFDTARRYFNQYLTVRRTQQILEEQL